MCDEYGECDERDSQSEYAGRDDSSVMEGVNSFCVGGDRRSLCGIERLVQRLHLDTGECAFPRAPVGGHADKKAGKATNVEGMAFCFDPRGCG